MQAINALEVMNFIDELPQPPRRKIYNNRANPITDLPDVEFRRRYRFEKASIHFIVDLVRADLIKDRRGAGLTPELQVLTAIRCWGRKEIQDDAAELHGLSQPTVSRVCAAVARALARHSAHYIKMPANAAEREEACRRFYALRAFPTVIGCIDCTHIRVKKTGGDAAQYYINRKGYYSLNVQVTCDANLKIIDIVARWRGSTHDARIFNECSLRERFEAGEFPGKRLLGDSGYKLEPYLLTPLLRPQTQAEERYNEAHIATRNTVERCFGVWKSRFRCLQQGMSVKLANTKTTIIALAVLHNIAIASNEPHPDADENAVEEQAEELVVHAPNRAPNNAHLRAFIQRHFQ